MAPEVILSRLGVTDVLTVSVDDTVEQALNKINDKKLRAAPVVDKDGVFKGMFSAHEIIKSLVPSYMVDGMQTLDFAVGASSVLGTRMKKMFPTRVGDHIFCDDCVKISTKTNSWEVLRLLTRHGSPLPVIDPKTGVLKGLISEQSAMDALLKMDIDHDEF